MAIGIGRRKFISAIGSMAVALPLVARAQQPALRVVGFINAASPQSYVRELAAFLNGLSEAGYVDGHSVVMEYLWAEGRTEKILDEHVDLVI